MEKEPYLSKACKCTDEGSEEDLQQEQLSFLNCVVARLDEQSGRQES